VHQIATTLTCLFNKGSLPTQLKFRADYAQCKKVDVLTWRQGAFHTEDGQHVMYPFQVNQARAFFCELSEPQKVTA